MSNAGMDDLDKRLIALLRENARTPTESLAKTLKVARGTVQNRIERLQRSRTLLGFTIRVDEGDAKNRVRAVTSIAVEGERSAAVVAALRALPEVRAVHTTNGRWDLIAELDAPDLAAFGATLDRMRSIAGIAASETSLLLTTVKF